MNLKHDKHTQKKKKKTNFFTFFLSLVLKCVNFQIKSTDQTKNKTIQIFIPLKKKTYKYLF